MSNGYKYYAFISYSHKDRKWARWIHNAIEHYRLPSVMRKAENANCPKKMAPDLVPQIMRENVAHPWMTIIWYNAYIKFHQMPSFSLGTKEGVAK